jgi:hypothetical protein
MRRHMQLHPKPKCFVSNALSQKTNIVDVPAAWVSDGSVHRVCALVELPRVQNLFRLEQILLGRVVVLPTLHTKEQLCANFSLRRLS